MTTRCVVVERPTEYQELLLRHGIAYTGGNAWTGVHDTWLRPSGSTCRAGRPPTTPRMRRRC